ncbi:MAG TPA: VPLPA-CTERM sorting domain-containing protein [Spongiibacteraceae bacterium]|nr:VPLPA-CTERM sorting domain-containing protein [Spongiibacteraceae bacterium]
MKVQLLAAAAAFSISGLSSATAINFNNGSGTYSAGGVSVAVASTGTGAGRYYSSVENALGVGNSSTNGGIGCKDSGCADIFTGSGFVSTEALTFTFSEKVKLNTVTFTQWENNYLGFGDWATFTYYVGTTNTVAGTVEFKNSGLGDGASVLLDPFSLGGLELSKFTITGKKGTKTVGSSNVTAWTSFYVHDLDYTKIAATPTVPVPAAAWLMGSGVLGLAGVARRRAA